jgi:hypothetical protein
MENTKQKSTTQTGSATKNNTTARNQAKLKMASTPPINRTSDDEPPNECRMLKTKNPFSQKQRLLRKPTKTGRCPHFNKRSCPDKNEPAEAFKQNGEKRNWVRKVVFQKSLV